ncbi:hypothetical protein [Tenacibaculum sp. 190524A02b]|uniref:hypothetical protein n=1 Tax=Tenacibaculum vairaonense TaxID=3137860 RepID=UPI0031FAF476
MALRIVQKNLRYLFVFGLLLIAASCQNSDADVLPETLTEIPEDEVLNVVLADDISDDIDNILDDDDADFSKASAKGVTPPNSHPGCVVRSIEETTTGKIVTLDFGDGCESKRGRVLTGKIIIEYVRTGDGFSKTVTFENFTAAGNSVEGTKSISKVKENASGNPEKTHMVDITITLTTGEVITKKGQKVKEKIEGADTDTRGDDVYSISGNWESVNKEGKIKKAVITTNLRREYACKYIVSGVIELTKDASTYTLDFGDGTCDNLATLTDASGNSKEITLRDRKRKK